MALLNTRSQARACITVLQPSPLFRALRRPWMPCDASKPAHRQRTRCFDSMVLARRNNGGKPDNAEECDGLALPMPQVVCALWRVDVKRAVCVCDGLELGTSDAPAPQGPHRCMTNGGFIVCLGSDRLALRSSARRIVLPVDRSTLVVLERVDERTNTRRQMAALREEGMNADGRAAKSSRTVTRRPARMSSPTFHLPSCAPCEALAVQAPVVPHCAVGAFHRAVRAEGHDLARLRECPASLRIGGRSEGEAVVTGAVGIVPFRFERGLCLV